MATSGAEAGIFAPKASAPEPTRAAARARWDAFRPRAGRAYGQHRNRVAPGPGWDDPASPVSGLSPWVRHRLLTEAELVAEALATHGPEGAGRFVQEVCWRTYWKGWLELRPAVWDDWRARRDAARAAWAEPARRARLAQAAEGETGVDAFDAWARKLRDTGWLHNHERLWFASAWIFTLGLPWELGADLFFRRLLDGDAASNTLSWRWVAGLQTAGKHYLAKADVIDGCTDGRVAVPPGWLAADAAPRPRDEALVDPPAGPLPEPAAPRPGVPALWLLHEDDAEPASWRATAAVDVPVVGVAGLEGAGARFEAPGWPVAPAAAAFARGAVRDAVARASALGGAPVLAWEADAETLIRAAREAGAGQIVTPYAPVGPARAGLDALESDLARAGLPLARPRRAWDTAAWPHAARGFFRFRQALPGLLGLDGPVARLGLPG